MLLSPDYCPCGSNKESIKCCQTLPGFYLKRPFKIPTGLSGYSHPKCYLGMTCDCDAKLSKEHLINEALHQMMGGFTAIETLVTNVGAKIPNPLPFAEKASVLCERHNNMLGYSTDAAAIRVLKAIESANRNIGDGKAVLVSGHDFERFLFQRLAAHHFGKVFTANGEKTEADLPASIVEDFMLHNRLPKGAGLYIGHPPAHFDPNKTGWEVAPLYAPDPNSERRHYAGIRFSWRDYAFFLMLDGSTPFEYRDPNRYRPMGISILKQPDDSVLTEIWFSWPYGTEGSGYVGTDLEFVPPTNAKGKLTRFKNKRER